MDANCSCWVGERPSVDSHVHTEFVIRSKRTVFADLSCKSMPMWLRFKTSQRSVKKQAHIEKLHCSEWLKLVNKYIVPTHSMPANSLDTLPYISSPLATKYSNQPSKLSTTHRPPIVNGIAPATGKHGNIFIRLTIQLQSVHWIYLLHIIINATHRPWGLAGIWASASMECSLGLFISDYM